RGGNCSLTVAHILIFELLPRIIDFGTETTIEVKLKPPKPSTPLVPSACTGRPRNDVPIWRNTSCEPLRMRKNCPTSKTNGSSRNPAKTSTPEGSPNTCPNFPL